MPRRDNREPIVDAVIATRREEMAAFDALPRALRDLINYAPVNQSAVSTQELVRTHPMGAAFMVAMMQRGNYVIGRAR